MKIISKLMFLLVSATSVATESPQVILKAKMTISYDSQYYFRVSKTVHTDTPVYRIESWKKGEAEPSIGSGKVTKPYHAYEFGKWWFRFSGGAFYDLGRTGNYCYIQEADCEVLEVDGKAIEEAYESSLEN